MPGYRTHISVSSVCGIALSGVSFCFGKIDIMTSLYGGSLCAIGGLIPDIDSKTSESFRKCLAIVAGFSSLLLVSRLRDFQTDPQTVAMIGGGNFVLVWFFLGRIINKVTVHRGMCHSIPMAVLVGEIIFLLSSGGVNERLFVAVCASSGVMVHLMLDEFYSVQVKGGVKIKKSLGSALKLVDFDRPASSFILFAILGFFTFTAINEPVWTENLPQENDEIPTGKRGAEYLEQVQTNNSDLYDLAVVEWAAKNDMIIKPADSNNSKWSDLERLFHSPPSRSSSSKVSSGARMRISRGNAAQNADFDILKFISRDVPSDSDTGNSGSDLDPEI